MSNYSDCKDYFLKNYCWKWTDEDEKELTIELKEIYDSEQFETDDPEKWAKNVLDYMFDKLYEEQK